MDLRGMRWEYVGWIHLAQDRDKRRALVYTGSVKGSEFLDYLSKC